MTPIDAAQAQQDAVAAAVAAEMARNPRILVGGPGAMPAPAPRVEVTEDAAPTTDDRDSEPVKVAASVDSDAKGPTTSRRRARRATTEPAAAAPPAEPAPTPAPPVASPAPEATPVPAPARQPTLERVLVRAPGFARVVLDGEGKVIWPPQPELPELPPPDDPQVFYEVDPATTFATTEGRLLAEGWACPRPDIHEVLRQREKFRRAVQELNARAVTDPGLIAAAVRHEDVDAIIAAMGTNALAMWRASQIGTPGSDLAGISYQLEKRWWELRYQHQRSILRSLIGRDSAAANRLRSTVEALARLPAPPQPSFNDYVLFGY
jgi:hypothetical protein